MGKQRAHVGKAACPCWVSSVPQVSKQRAPVGQISYQFPTPISQLALRDS